MNSKIPQNTQCILILVALAAVISLAGFAPHARAANTWTGAGANNNWSTPENWDDGMVPVPDTDVTLSGATRLNINYDLPPETFYRSIIFAANAGAFTISGNEFWINKNSNIIFTNNTNLTQTFNCDVRLSRQSGGGDGSVVQPGGGAIVFNGSINYDGVWLFPNTSRGTLIVNGVGTGTGNNYAGNSYIYDFSQWAMRNNVADTVVEIGNPLAFSIHGIQMNASTYLRAGVDLTGNDAVPNPIALTNTLVVSGSHGIEFTGNVYQANGNRQVSVTNTGQTTFSGTVCLSTYDPGYTLTFQVAPTAGRTVVSGAIVNRMLSNLSTTPSSFTKGNAGDLHLYGVNTYTGRTSVSANGGGLYLNGSHALSANQPGDSFANYEVGANATLGGSGTLRPVAGPGTLPGLDRILLSNNSRMRAGDAAIPTNVDGVIVPEARTFTLDHSESKPQTLVAFGGVGVAMEFALGRQGTNTKIAIVGRAGIAANVASLKFAASHVFNFVDVAGGKLDAGDYILVSTDGDASTYSGLEVDAGNIITNLSVGAGLEYYTNTANYSGFVLLLINNNIVLRVLPPEAPVIENSDLDFATGEHAYFEYQIAATNLATSYTVEGTLPDNVTLDEDTGLISGTPMITGAYPVVIKAANAGGTDSKALTINVMPVTVPAEITSSLTARPIRGERFSYAIRGSNYPSDFSAIGLPSWLTLTRNVISGTVPLDAPVGDIPVTILAGNDIGGDTKTLTLTVMPVLMAPVITSGLSVNGVITKALQYQITAANTPSSFSATGLPVGVVINTTTGRIFGFPAKIGIYSVTITASNGGGSGSAKLSITVVNVPGAGLVFYTPTLASGSTGSTFNFAVAADGSPPPSNYSATGLPPGLTIDSVTGVISGTPTASGVFAVAVTASTDNNTFSATSTLAITVHGNAALATPVPSTAGFNYPTAAVMGSAGVMYVADTGNDGIKKVASDGTVTTLAAMPAGASPLSLAIDAQGNLYAGATDGNVYKITPGGSVSTHATGFGCPGGLAFEAGGTLYVADTGNNTIKAVSTSGAATLVAGSGAAGFADGMGASATFDGPTGLVFNAATNTLYIADTNNSIIRAIDIETGIVTTEAGVAGQPYGNDGKGTTARFNTPEALALDAAGLIYVADTGNNTVRVFDPVSKTVSTVIGDPNNAGSSDGASGDARMNGPAGIVVNTHGDGSVYIIDTNNSAIRSLAAGPVIVTPLRDRVVRTRTSANFDGTAWGSPAPAYKWLRTGAVIPGAASATYTIDYVKEADTATYTVVAANSSGQSESSFDLTVTGKDFDTFAESDGLSSGGGGAPSAWFLGVIAALALLRRAKQCKRHC